MGTSQRQKLSATSEYNPGPGQYTPGLETRPKSPNWKYNFT